MKKIKKFISEIQDDFLKERFKIFNSSEKPVSEKTYNEAFESFRTKAFQLGLVIAFFETVEDASDTVQVEKFIKKLNSISAYNWVNIFRELAPHILEGVNPRKWPGYHKIILRILKTNLKGKAFFPNRELGNSPEVVLFKKLLEGKIKSWCVNQGIIRRELKKDQLDSQLSEKWIEELPEKVKDIFETCGLKLLEGIKFEKLGKEYLKDKVSS